MQHDDGCSLAEREDHVVPLRARNHAVAQYHGLALAQQLLPYGVRMRNAAEQRKTWGTYVSTLRDALGLSRQEFADKIGNTDAATVWRWETFKTKPESTDKPERISTAFRVPLDEVLTAASLRPDGEVPAEPTRQDIDEEIERIRRSGLSKRVQEQLVQHVLQERQRDEQRRREQTDFMIKQAGGKVD